MTGSPLSREPANRRWHIPVMGVAVFGFGGLVAIAVVVVLFLGLSTATRNTSELLQARARAVINELELRLDATLAPIVDQAQWIEGVLIDRLLADPNIDSLDPFMTGALAATPQVTGLGVVSADAMLRRWGREDGSVVVEDWSNRPVIIDWLRESRGHSRSRWSQPLWTHTLNRTVVFHETPLHHGDRFLGVLVQVVPIEKLSRVLSRMALNTSMVPYVLYDDRYVLAHPLLSRTQGHPGDAESPMPKISELGDPTLVRLRNTRETPYFLRGLTDVRAAIANLDGDDHVLLEKDITEYGDRKWTVGVRLDTTVAGGDEEPKRIGRASQVGAIVLVLAIAAAVFVGRRLSQPVKLLARAAEAVAANDLDRVPALPGSRVRELDQALRSFRHMIDGLRERRLMRDVLGRLVPESVARTLLTRGGTILAEESEATLLFCDLEGFTALTERVGATGIVALLNEYFEAMVVALERHGGIVTQFQGDAILATFNVPLADPGHAANALRAALEMQRVVSSRTFAGERLAFRIGINTGTVVSGAVGAKGRLSYTVHGDAVNMAARLESMNKEFGTRILVSGITAERVTDFNLHRVGQVSVRGQSAPVELFNLRDDGTADG